MANLKEIMNVHISDHIVITLDNETIKNFWKSFIFIPNILNVYVKVNRQNQESGVGLGDADAFRSFIMFTFYNLLSI